MFKNKSPQKETTGIKISSLQAQLEQKKRIKSKKKFKSREASLKASTLKEIKSTNTKFRNSKFTYFVFTGYKIYFRTYEGGFEQG